MNLIIDNDKTDKFIVKTEKGKLNIYKGGALEELGRNVEKVILPIKLVVGLVAGLAVNSMFSGFVGENATGVIVFVFMFAIIGAFMVGTGMKKVSISANEKQSMAQNFLDRELSFAGQGGFGHERYGMG